MGGRNLRRHPVYLPVFRFIPPFFTFHQQKCPEKTKILEVHPGGSAYNQSFSKFWQAPTFLRHVTDMHLVDFFTVQSSQFQGFSQISLFVPFWSRLYISKNISFSVTFTEHFCFHDLSRTNIFLSRFGTPDQPLYKSKCGRLFSYLKCHLVHI